MYAVQFLASVSSLKNIDSILSPCFVSMKPSFFTSDSMSLCQVSGGRPWFFLIGLSASIVDSLAGVLEGSRSICPVHFILLLL